MSPNPTVLLLFFILSLLGLTLLLLFIPTIVEMRKPKDQGPRKIVERTRSNPEEHGYPQAQSSTISRQNLPENLQDILRELEGKEMSAIGVDAVRIGGGVMFPSEIEVQKASSLKAS